MWPLYLEELYYKKETLVQRSERRYTLIFKITQNIVFLKRTENKLQDKFNEVKR